MNNSLDDFTDEGKNLKKHIRAGEGKIRCF